MKYVHAVVLIGFLSATVSADDDAPFEQQLAERRSEYGQWIADTFGKLEPTDRPESSGHATAYRLRDAAGTVGFISAITAPFCASCNRLRFSSDGRLVACLFEGGEVDLRTLLRSNAGDDAIENAFTKAAALKPLRHSRSRAIPMSTLGG